MEENNVQEEKVQENAVQENVVQEETVPAVNTGKKGNKWLIYGLIGLVVIAVIVLLCYFLIFKGGDKKEDKKETKNKEYKSEYTLQGNELQDFDIYFLKKEIKDKNIVYSPLSIKYALLMLNEGTDGDSHGQIEAVLGDYKAKKYENNTNMSFANVLFIQDDFKNQVLNTYVDTLKDRYGAEIGYDSFSTAANLNKWVSDKTFGLIKDLFTDNDVNDKDFILINALAIDMEWVKLIQPKMSYSQDFLHENYYNHVSGLIEMGYEKLTFNGNNNTKAVKFTAVANRYDIIKDLGEENIKKKIAEEYEKFLKDDVCGYTQSVEEIQTQFLKDLKTNYGIVNSSTDFRFLDTEDEKVFAKDLKTYGETTLEYIAIMPKNVSLDEYVKNTNSKKLSTLLESIKSIQLDSFKDGVITEVYGTIPLFNYDYELDLEEDLKSMGIVDVFDKNKADLSKISSSKEYIGDAAHKANIEFSNEGIKAAAATQMGGLGNAACEFDYLFEVPVEKIDLTFDKPFMYIIRDKNTKEVWFVGAVYEGVKYKAPSDYGVME